MTSSKMPSRRQLKVARVIKEAVSDILRNQLNDPRVDGLISITEVDVSPDMRTCDVFLSILSPSEVAARDTFRAVVHATKYIQGEVGKRMTTRYFPALNFKEDVKVKKTLEVLKLIDQASSEYKDKDVEDNGQEDLENSDGGME